MPSILLIMLCVLNTQDPIQVPFQAKRQEYKREIAINGLLSIGLSTLSGIYWKKGNDAYDNYQQSMTSADALHYWEQTQTYDRIRNVCGIGALFFIGRTIYYYAKLMDAGKRVGSIPDLDFRYTEQGSLLCVITKRF